MFRLFFEILWEMYKVSFIMLKLRDFISFCACHYILLLRIFVFICIYAARCSFGWDPARLICRFYVKQKNLSSQLRSRNQFMFKLSEQNKTWVDSGL